MTKDPVKLNTFDIICMIALAALFVLGVIMYISTGGE